jgi:hypothetical protein
VIQLNLNLKLIEKNAEEKGEFIFKKLLFFGNENSRQKIGYTDLDLSLQC